MSVFGSGSDTQICRYLCPTLPKVNTGVAKNEKTTATPVFDRSLEDKTVQENKEGLGENSLSAFCSADRGFAKL